MDNKLNWKVGTKSTFEIDKEEVIATESILTIGTLSPVGRLTWKLETKLDVVNKERSLQTWCVAPV